MNPYVGEIRLLPWGWAPKDWHVCDGALLPIRNFSALFSLLGAQYGGDGVTNFALPDLRGRTPVHTGPVHGQGAIDGAETVTLKADQLPIHSHLLIGATEKGSAFVANGAFATIDPAANYYAVDTTTQALNATSVQAAGSGGAHANMQPYLALNYCIALAGVFPPHN